MAKNRSVKSDQRPPDDEKTHQEILVQEIDTALSALGRPTAGLLLSGFSAGLDIGFSLLLMAVLWTLFHDTLGEGFLRVILANAYALGFVFVVLGKSELFTEHTTRAVLPVLAGKATWPQLARLWGLIYVSNLVGAAAFAALIAAIAPPLGVEPRAFEAIATSLTRHPFRVMLSSAVLAGWLMGLLSWLVKAGQETISKLAVVWMITATIGLVGLHHSIAGTVEVLAGVFTSDALTWLDYGRFLLWATIGNAVGGVFFVAVVKYAHARDEVAG